MCLEGYSFEIYNGFVLEFWKQVQYLHSVCYGAIGVMYFEYVCKVFCRFGEPINKHKKIEIRNNYPEQACKM